ncbi:hypothetical protein SAMN05444365_104222 [Micromonospora pattaloongensis]|uniref:Flavin reductase n=1 Tax=Micromonospora pattaloongensis TaxID=405436 RepID=A0A1H3NXT3_9ACTN|nr:hypothetical protein [Micromonospora pattaloongensis]SDY93687.1 hypothetical protein SAMN05444365_104222 [Micromonospora pattaloongensis]
MGDYPALHAPSRPDWACTVCGDEWPCPTRKRQLVELFGGNVRALVGYLRPYLVVANTELGRLSTRQVVERFIGWCARPPRGGWGGRVRKRQV